MSIGVVSMIEASKIISIVTDPIGFFALAFCLIIISSYQFDYMKLFHFVNIASFHNI